MMKPALPEQRQRLVDVDSSAVRVGNDVIELLTSGMYVSPITIYREYIQNSADAIDVARTQQLLGAAERGRVSIEIDNNARSICIRDNGSGIGLRDFVSRMLAIGGSPKRGTQARGFRGVGRLAGLAYCRKLVFRAKAPGENKVTSLAWDCRALRSRLLDVNFSGDLGQIVCDSVSIQCEEAESKSEHFFEVHLHDVVRLRNDLLLNENLIRQYLAQVGPLPFAPEFSFASAIENRISRGGSRIPVELTVAGEAVYRPYRDEVVIPGTQQKVRIEEIDFFEFPDVDGELGAIGWIGHHQYIRSIPGGLGIRGLRARVGDIQIGEADIFDESFREPRFNAWSIGEICILDHRIVPNARRDNFEINHHYYNLLAQIGPVAAKLAQRCRTASISRNSAQVVYNTISEVDARLKEERSLDPAEFSRLRSALLRARTKLKGIDEIKLRDTLAAEVERVEASLAAYQPIQGASVIAFDEVVSLVSRHVTNREQVKKLVAELRSLCS